MQILLLQKTEPSRQGESINLATLGKSVSVQCESSRDQKETSKSVNRKEIDDVSAASDSSIVEEQIRGVRINNVLPPLHASIKRYAPNEEVKNKVIHIPINAVMELEEVHSPILNKRRQSRAEPEEGKAFGIFIQPVQQQQQ